MNQKMPHLAPSPLPATLAELDALRIIKHERTINDMVEELHRGLWESDPKYRTYLNAVWDEQAVEGSLSADNVFASLLIRDRAKQIESEIAELKIATISKSLNVVLRRYRLSRKQRRYMVAGEIVPNEDGNGVTE